MPNTKDRDAGTGGSHGFRAGWMTEAIGLAALAAMVAYYLAVSWRKWPDPMIDSGPQWYAAWRMANGALLYHDLTWNYGPLSAFFNAVLFRLFGPGMLVLVTANLVIYALILALAYLAFRRAWGRLAAFAACAVFISVFSFSILNSVGNYNYATPYAHEATHGMLVILISAFVVARWSKQPSPLFAFLLGLCGGLATVLKPEFMLATCVLGIAGWLLRIVQQQRPRVEEYLYGLAGLALPTLIFTAWFLRTGSAKLAFIDASKAWWMVLVDHTQTGTLQQQVFSGLNSPWANARTEFVIALIVLMTIGAMWAAGWIINRPWGATARSVLALAATVLACFSQINGGWRNIGSCLPVLCALVLVVVLARLAGEIRRTRCADDSTVMALALVLLAGSMLARMLLSARIHHLGFYQAALAGMVVAAALVAEMPRWTGAGLLGRRFAAVGGLAALAVGCIQITTQSNKIRADQTVAVGEGRDRFYAFDPAADATGTLVNWTLAQIRAGPTNAAVLVLPEGAMINYLARRVSPIPAFVRPDDVPVLLARLRAAPPEFVVLFSRDLREYGVQRFGARGTAANALLVWVNDNYEFHSRMGGDPLDVNDAKGSVIFRRKPGVKPVLPETVPAVKTTGK